MRVFSNSSGDLGSSQLRLLMTGSVPPPVGGVTVFTKYFLAACSEVSGVKVRLLTPRALTKLLESDVLIINSSHPIKRFLHVLLGRLFGLRVVVVKHGGKFRSLDPLLLLGFFGVECVCHLNNEVAKQLKPFAVHRFSLPTVFAENITAIRTSTGPLNLLPAKGARSRVLFYSGSGTDSSVQSVYGIDVLAGALEQLPSENLELVIVDLQGGCAPFLEKLLLPIHSFSRPVSFIQLLREVDLYVRPTRSDGMSVAVLEAQAMGVPVVASDVVDRPGFVRIFPTGNVDELAKAIEETLTLPPPEYVIDAPSVESFLNYLRG